MVIHLESWGAMPWMLSSRQYKSTFGRAMFMDVQLVRVPAPSAPLCR
jgi:hypothetical protein